MLLTLVTMMTAAAATAKPGQPDFAYPLTVKSDAEKSLRAAIKAGDDCAIVKAVLQYSTAEEIIRDDSIFDMPAWIASNAAQVKSPDAKALLDIIEALTLRKIYRSDSWKYNQVVQPLKPLPANIDAWSGVQFCHRIDSLLGSAYQLAASAPQPLERWTDIIKADRLTLQYYPTVRDFAAVQLLDNLQRYTGFDYDAVRNGIIKSQLSCFDQGSAPWCWWRLMVSHDMLRDDFLELYKRYNDSEAARLFLLEYLDATDPDKVTKADIDMAEESLARFPAFWNNNSLRNRIAELLTPTLECSVSSVVPLGRPMNITVKYANVKKSGGVIVYRGPANSVYTASIDKASRTEVARFAVHPTDSLPYTAVETFTFTPTDEAYYIIRPYLEGVTTDRYDNTVTLATSLTPILLSSHNDMAVLVASATDGHPVQSVAVSAVSTAATRSSVSLGKTDDEGTLRFRYPTALGDKAGERAYLKFTSGKKDYVFNRQIAFNKPYDRSAAQTSRAAVVFTDRALYHPGDSVAWAAVVTCGDNGNSTQATAKGQQVRVTLMNPNRQTVGDTTLTTDGNGHIEGRFAIPDDGLTGRFAVSVLFDGHTIGNTALTVSDFKLPTFRVELDSVERNLPQTGWLTLAGRAMTYAMMPVEGARVTAQIFQAWRGRWFQPQQQLGVINAVTDRDGEFTIAVPDTLLDKYQLGWYTATVTVTSAAGESQQADKPFVTGKPLDIVSSGDVDIDTDRPAVLPVKVYDASGNEVEPALNWAIWQDDRRSNQPTDAPAAAAATRVEVAAGHVDAGNYSVDWSSIPSGTYTLTVVTADPTSADSCTSEIRLYNSRLGTMPDNAPMYIPAASVTVPHGSDAELLYGVPADTYLYMALAADSTLVSVEGLETTAGFHRMRLTLPEGCEHGRLTIYAVRDAEVFSRTIDIYEPVDRKLEVEVESFRDRITPGSSEQWSFRLRAPGSVGGTTGAMIATAYNQALDALQPLDWIRSFAYHKIWPNLQARWFYNHNDRCTLRNYPRHLQILNLEMPAFLYSPSGQMLYTVTYRSANKVTAAQVEGEADLRVSAIERKTYASFAGAMTDEAADVEEAEPELDADGDTGRTANSTDFEYRDGETLQAFWQPDLVSDGAGNITLAFTVPNANGSWHMQAFVWDQLMNSGTLARDFVTSKQVMVQPNLPRFMRAGDSAELLATVYNNSAEADSVNTVVECYDLATGKVLTQNIYYNHVAANGSAVVAMPVEAPGNVSAIGYRVRSTMGRFTDGEQTAIPVLPASDQVTDSRIFVMRPGQSSAELQLPKSRDMQLVLQYCANPAWDVIKALPSLYQGRLTTATQAALQLYRAAASAGLANSDPAISSMLQRALTTAGDSSLVSQLSKNDELKQATLQQTPWVQAAAGQTQQMASLALLFDTKAVNADINAAVKLLEKLQNSDGGWSWGEWSHKSSRWTTANVLNTLGLLNATGMLPTHPRLKPMVQQAMQYMQSTFTPQQTTDLTFTILSYYFPDFTPSVRGRQIIDATLQSLVGDWRSHSVTAKATDALLLDHFGYRKVAGEVIASIDQFAVSDADGSVSFPSVRETGDYAPILFAYATLQPTSALVDGMRQWLVMRSQYNYGMAADNVTMLIAAYLRSGSRWTVPATAPRIQIADSTIQLPAGELMTGMFTTTLDNRTGSRLLTVDRGESAVPAWGALLSRYTARIDQIKAAACSQLSIDKELSVLRDGKWIYADDVRLGEQVRVILTIKVKDDLSYVTVIDDRPAGFEPIDQLPGYDLSGGVSFYRESGNSATRFFIDYLPKGTYRLSYLATASTAGDFMSGVATVQSQFTPSAVAHSSGRRLTVQAR